MKYKAPEPARPRQKTLAALLAVGASAKEAAEAVGVSVTYVKQMMRGELFQYEIDEQRRALIGERVGEYAKLVSEQLEPNLRALIAVRDDPESKPADRLRAIELINAAVVPKARPKQVATEMRVSMKIAPEHKAAIEAAAAEDK